MNPQNRCAWLLALSLSLTVCGSVAASGLPATGLGQSWPATTDVSSRPEWHVYLFQRGNTRYIQVNDSNGTVRGAFAKTPYALVGLPIGADAGNLATPDEPLPSPASKTVVPLYSGDGVQVFAAPQANGAVRLMAVGSECKNPLDCSKISL